VVIVQGKNIRRKAVHDTHIVIGVAGLPKYLSERPLINLRDESGDSELATLSMSAKLNPAVLKSE